MSGLDVVRRETAFGRAANLSNETVPKVKLLRRFIHEIWPDVRVTALANDILDERTVDELSRCDLVLGGTDSFYTRAVLGDLSTHYLILIWTSRFRCGLTAEC